jgi:hypothetical protein
MPELETTVVSTLICHRDVEMGISCLGSMARNSAEPVEFFLHEDGSLTEEDRERLQKALPVHGIVDRRDADRIVKPQLLDYPLCARFRRQFVLGLKLFDVPLLAPSHDVVYCDTDICFLRPFKGLFDWPDLHTGCVFMRDYQNAVIFRPWHLACDGKLQMPARLNSGLFYFRREFHDLEFLEGLLQRFQPLFLARHPWAEQTCWAALAMECGGRFWSEKQLCVVENEASISDDLIAAHLVTPVRGLLPKLVGRPADPRPPEALVTEPMPRLGAVELGVEQIRRFLKRKTSARA